MNSVDPIIKYRTYAQRLDLDGDPVGNAVELFVLLDVDPGIFRHHASLPRPNGAAWFAAATHQHIYAFEYDGSAIGAPQVLLDNGEGNPDMDLRDMFAFEHQGGTWLTFSEQQYSTRRVLLAKPGCRYESGYLRSKKQGEVEP